MLRHVRSAGRMGGNALKLVPAARDCCRQLEHEPDQSLSTLISSLILESGPGMIAHGAEQVVQGIGQAAQRIRHAAGNRVVGALMTMPKSGVQQLDCINTKISADRLAGDGRAPLPVVYHHKVPAQRGLNFQATRQYQKRFCNPLGNGLAVAAVGRQVRQTADQDEQPRGIPIVVQVRGRQRHGRGRRNTQEVPQGTVARQCVVLMRRDGSRRQRGGAGVLLEDPILRDIGEKCSRVSQYLLPRRELAAKGAAQPSGRHESPISGDVSGATRPMALEQLADLARNVDENIAHRTQSRGGRGSWHPPIHGDGLRDIRFRAARAGHPPSRHGCRAPETTARPDARTAPAHRETAPG